MIVKTPTVRLVERDLGRRHFEVSIAGRTYRAVHHVRHDRWDVTNSRGYSLQEYHDTWCRVVAMCEAEFARIEPAEAECPT